MNKAISAAPGKSVPRKTPMALTEALVARTMICTGETYKSVVKLTFAKGAALPDPARLFNSSLDGNTRRAIDFQKGEEVDEEALKALVRAAVALNKSKAKR